MGRISSVGVITGVGNGVYVAVGGNQTIVGVVVALGFGISVSGIAVGLGVESTLQDHKVMLRIKIQVHRLNNLVI